jgi:hypothetical protein
MASTINAKTTGVGGIDASGDASGVLALQTGGTTAVTIDASQNVSTVKDVNIHGLTVGLGAGSVATNTAVGTSALAANTTGANNVAVGLGALVGNTSGVANTAIGTGIYGTTAATLQTNTNGSYNTALGNSALGNNSSGSYNTAIGFQSGYLHNTGLYNVFIGRDCGYTGTGAESTFVGHTSGYYTTGSYNTFLGRQSGYLVTTGTNNTILGSYNGNQGGLDIRTASNNVVLSDGAGNIRQIIDANGNLLVGGTTAGTAYLGFGVQPNGNNPLVYCTGTATTNATSTYFIYSTGASAFRFYVDYGGTIHATSTSISAISDATLKENIRDLETGLSEILALKPRRFDWINGDKQNVAGFIAQEVAEILPELVEDSLYSQDAEGNDILMDVSNIEVSDILIKSGDQEIKSSVSNVTTSNGYNKKFIIYLLSSIIYF